MAPDDPVGGALTPRRVLDGADAALFDLDGTLVRLAVAWWDFRDQLREFLEPDVLPTGPERPATATLQDLLEAERHDDHRRVLDLLAEAEAAGVPGSTRVPAGVGLYRAASDAALPLAVVSNNLGATVRAALERHGLRAAADVVLGVDDVPRPKPHPAPVEQALDALGVAPGAAVFVGNDWKDFEAGKRAGVRTLDVADLPHPSNY